MSRIFRASVLTTCLLAATSTAHADVVYTPTNGPTCRDYSKQYMSDWICPGPGGMVARFTDEGNMASVTIGRGPRADGRLDHASTFRGSGDVFGKKLEWHLVDGVPRSAVLRVFQVDTTKDGEERQVQKLEVYAINNKVTCLFAAVDASQPNANAKAGAHADNATRWFCTEKWRLPSAGARLPVLPIGSPASTLNDPPILPWARLSVRSMIAMPWAR
jgi:hypothetical protein